MPFRKCGRFGRGEFLREFQRFVNHDLHRRRAGSEFVNREPKDAPIDGRQPLQSPIFRELANEFVARFRLSDRLPRTAGRRTCECHPRRAQTSRNSAPFAFRVLMRHVPLEQHLQRKLPRLPAELISCRAAIYCGVFCESFRESWPISTAPMPSLVALIAAFEPGAVDRLFERVACENAEHHRNARIKLRDLDSAGGFGADVIVVSSLAAQHASDADNRIECFRCRPAFSRQSRISSDPGTRTISICFSVGSGLLERFERAIKQAVGDEIVELADDDPDAQSCCAQSAAYHCWLQLRMFNAPEILPAAFRETREFLRACLPSRSTRRKASLREIILLPASCPFRAPSLPSHTSRPAAHLR